MNKQWIEQRLCPRFAIEGATISYQHEKLLGFMMKVDEEDCPVLNLARGGIKFVHQKPLKFNSELCLRLFIPNEGAPLSLKGRVRRSNAHTGKSYKYRASVQFNAYGPEKTQNSPRLLDRLITLEEKFLEEDATTPSVILPALSL